MNKLIPITPQTTSADLQPHTSDLSSLYLIFLPTRYTKISEIDQVHKLVQDLNLPPKNFIEINLSSIVQKTWRIIKHYENDQASTALPKNEPNRKIHNTELARQNKIRLQQIQTQIEQLVVQDQATKLNAKIIQ